MVDVVLGPVGPGSVAATTFVLVERGAARRPELARRLPSATRLVFAEGHPPVRIAFDGARVEVGDDALAPPGDAALVVTAPLPALLAQLTVPLTAGIPSPLTPEGRGVLRAVASGSVRVEGRMADGMRLLRLLSVRD